MTQSSAWSLTTMGVIHELESEEKAAERAEFFSEYIFFFADLVPPGESENYHDENTLNKVRDVLRSARSVEISSADELITMLQNEGILFRERTPSDV